MQQDNTFTNEKRDMVNSQARAVISISAHSGNAPSRIIMRGGGWLTVTGEVEDFLAQPR
jgi:hypothetical protein